MTARGRQNGGLLCESLPSNLAEIDGLLDHTLKDDPLLKCVLQLSLACKEVDYFREQRGRVDATSVMPGLGHDQCRLLLIACRHNEFLPRFRHERKRKHARNSSHLPVYPKFSDQDEVAFLMIGHVRQESSSLQHDDREWQIEPRPILWDRRRCEVDQDLNLRVRNIARPEGTTDSVECLADCSRRHAADSDCLPPGHALFRIDHAHGPGLDLDDQAIKADKDRPVERMASLEELVEAFAFEGLLIAQLPATHRRFHMSVEGADGSEGGGSPIVIKFPAVALMQCPVHSVTRTVRFSYHHHPDDQPALARTRSLWH